jgi:8-hydroxy-5-deazaflavin:NADPH oxidoreductase
MITQVQRTIAIIGGTGAEGKGLALRFGKTGARVLIGSRDVEKAQDTARRVNEAAGGALVEGRSNSEAVSEAEIVILAVPLAAQVGILKSIRDSFRPGAILVDTTVPLEVSIGGRVSRTLTLWDGSAAQQAARLAPPGIQLVAAFHSLSATALADLERPVDCDVLICGDSTEAKTIVRELAETISGVRAIDAGPLDNARLLENAAALLISLNLRYRVKHSGLRITGIDPQGASR